MIYLTQIKKEILIIGGNKNLHLNPKVVVLLEETKLITVNSQRYLKRNQKYLQKMSKWVTPKRGWRLWATLLFRDGENGAAWGEASWTLAYDPQAWRISETQGEAFRLSRLRPLEPADPSRRPDVCREGSSWRPVGDPSRRPDVCRPRYPLGVGRRPDVCRPTPGQVDDDMRDAIQSCMRVFV